MLYELPDSPEVHLVGPDDEAVWTALGVAASGRHAVIIGDPAAPAQATVITGTIADFAAWLDPVTGRGPAAQPACGISDEPAVVGVDADPPSVSELVTLPHTGIQVPDPTLRVSSLRQLPTPDGIAYTASLRRGRIPVGTIHNEGNGGATSYSPAAGSPFGPTELAAFIAASRTGGGQPISDENLFEAWITEFEHDKEVTAAVRLGRSPVRLRSPLSVADTFHDEHFDDVYYTARHLTAAKVATAADRTALTAELLRIPIEAGQWWQLWTGQRWEDLTPPSSRQPGSGK
jgi:hypothetical protein